MSSNGSYLSLVLNSGPVLIEEFGIEFRAIPRNGRYYHAWHPGKYPFPCDWVARDGDNVLNGVIFQYCLYNRDGLPEGIYPLENLVMMPITGVRYPNRVLDLGCGNGCWVIDVAKAFPNATVVGVDLVGCQDISPPPNVVFRVPTHGNDALALDFDEDLSSLGVNSFDYIRMAHLNGAVADERALLGKVFDLAVPATGHIEITFVDWYDVPLGLESPCHSDKNHRRTFRTANPDPLPSNCPLSKLQELLAVASWKRGIPLNPDPAKIDSLLVSTGFIDRIHRTHTLPLCVWSLDRCQRMIGERMKGLLLWRRSEDADTDGFFEGFSLELLTRWLGMTQATVIELAAQCAHYVGQEENRIFVDLHTFTARKPGQQFHDGGNPCEQFPFFRTY